MITRTPSCFRNGKKERLPLCSAGDHETLSTLATSSTHWGKITSRRHPPAGVFEEWARRLKCSVKTVRRMWEEGLL
jgi:hypothetical protein